ncbi:hypothetical protein KIN20_012494 [Parelaphostrongylus tenuis]|uniref:Uncharacterized protein n=1 Tax=Parelaphostrongylus tenuis TaxID=148309 RepID=A0AAD5N139_PARTN|nr:hypothetical protein KIN20_012494 [Parelaphostrongylus tenuis]
MITVFMLTHARVVPIFDSPVLVLVADGRTTKYQKILSLKEKIVYCDPLDVRTTLERKNRRVKIGNDD